MTEVLVEGLGEEDADRVASVLADAFSGYPVMRFVLGSLVEDTDPAPDTRTDQHRVLIRMFVMARVFRGEPMLAAFVNGELAAAAIASFPDGSPAPAGFQKLRAEVWKTLGTDAEHRYDVYGRATDQFAFDIPRVHLNMVGVLPPFRGRGVARRLIESVQEISRARNGSEGVTLTTETARNAAYYRSLGFEDAGYRRISDELESWGFFRPDRP